MADIKSISNGLELHDDGVWYGADTEEVSYPSDGNEASFAIEDDSFWFRHRNNCIISVVQSFPPQNGKTIFDIGGGNGFVSVGLSKVGFDVALVEPGQVGALHGVNRGIKNVICATTHTAKFKPNSLPTVGLFDVIEHIEDDHTFLKSIFELIEEGGGLYVTVPSYSVLWSDTDISAGHFRRYTVAEISKVLESAGFKIDFSSYMFRFLPPAIFLLRSLPFKLGLITGKKEIDRGAKGHPERGGVFGKLLEWLLRSELKCLNRKKSMWFGGSCLIVAKKPYEKRL